MSRTSLHRPHRPRAVWDRPAPGTRLLPTSSSFTVSPSNPLPSDGRSIDYMRQPLSKDLCRFNAPLTRRVYSAAIRIVGVYPQPANLGLRFRAIVPFYDSTPVTPGLPRSANHGVESIHPSPGAVEHCRRTDKPHAETPSTSVSLLRHACGSPRIAVDVQPPLKRIVDAGVVVFLVKSLGPSIALPSPTHKSAYPSPPIGGRPCLEEAAGPALAHPKETTTLSSTVRTPAACGNSPPSLPSSPIPAALPRVTPRKPGSLPPSHSPPLWIAFPSTLCNSPTQPCKTSIAPSKPFNPLNLSGQGNSPLLAQTKPKTPRHLRGFSENNQNSRLSPHINQKPPPPGPPCPLIPPSPIMTLKPPP